MRRVRVALYADRPELLERSRELEAAESDAARQAPQPLAPADEAVGADVQDV